MAAGSTFRTWRFGATTGAGLPATRKSNGDKPKEDVKWHSFNLALMR
jgi:hypothetical protein